MKQDIFMPEIIIFSHRDVQILLEKKSYVCGEAFAGDGTIASKQPECRNSMRITKCDCGCKFDVSDHSCKLRALKSVIVCRPATIIVYNSRGTPTFSLHGRLHGHITNRDEVRIGKF